MDSPIIGIDLGTTHSLAAYLDDGVPRLIPSAVGGVLTPSVVGVDLDGRVIVGRAARELQVTHPERTASLFKRLMGSDAKVALPGRSYGPEELSALVLRSLKADAEAHFGRAVDRAVITVPAYFHEHQRKATIHAGRIAGLTVERILNEPTAAALAYGFRDPDSERALLVFDLGGGTFDVSVVEIMAGAVEVRASSGEGFLGGEDFTRTLASRILDRAGLAFERAEVDSPKLVARLIQQAEAAKRTLSREGTATLRMPDRSGAIGPDARVEAVTREDFERWTAPLLARVESPVRRALADAGLPRSAIDEVILVGGATRMPGVRARVEALFGKAPRGDLNPDEVVALGASIQAGLIARDSGVEDLVVTDVAPFTMGIEVSKSIGPDHRDGYYLPVIHRNTTIPVSRVQAVATVEPNQVEVTVNIFQGEGRRVDDNLPLGRFAVRGIPRGPAGQGIEIRFTYDLNGVLEVEATIQATGARFTHVVAPQARGLSPAEVDRAVRAMQGLKTHPREEAANRYLLRRAERCFGQVDARTRQALDGLLDGFEAALGLSDEPAIAMHREALERFLDRIDPDGGRESEGDHAAW